MNIDSVLSVLNSAVAADKVAIADILDYRVSCTESLADHPHIVVLPGHGSYAVGALGLINGVLTSLGLPRVMAVYNESGELKEFVEYKG